MPPSTPLTTPGPTSSEGTPLPWESTQHDEEPAEPSQEPSDSRNATQRAGSESKHWEAWEERALARVVLDCDPYSPDTMPGDVTQKWTEIANRIHATTPSFQRTWQAC